MTTLVPLTLYDFLPDSIYSGLAIDSSGNLIGTTAGGSVGTGTVFELAKTSNGYSGTPVTLLSFGDFSSPIGTEPLTGVIIDGAGNIYGTTSGSDGHAYSSIFEIAKTPTGYANTPIILDSVSMAGLSRGFVGLTSDGSGNLFGTMEGGSNGAVIEIPRIGSGFGAPITVATFGVAGVFPVGPLAIDASGNIFGVAEEGGTGASGTVFEISKAQGSYASTATALVNFTAPLGDPQGGLIMDAAGNLYGVMDGGPSDHRSGVYEIVKNGNSYASSPTLLFSNDGTHGSYIYSTLFMDASGNLYFSIEGDGSTTHGAIYEISHSGGNPIDLANFTAAAGQGSAGQLIMDASGDLLGTTTSGLVFAVNLKGQIAAPTVDFDQAAQQYTDQAITLPISIGDTVDNLVNDAAIYHADALNSAALAGEISGVTLSGSGTQTITMLPFRAAGILALLDKITSPYTLVLTAANPIGATISGASSAEGNTVSYSKFNDVTAAAQVTITPAGDGKSFTVSYGGSIDHLTDIQALQFGTYTEFVAQTPGPANAITTGNVTELYSAVLAREPDITGLGFYQNYLAKNPNTPLLTFAEYFLSSTEYTSAHNYAQTTAGETQFIEDSYQNLLHRTPSASEVNYYLTGVLEQPGTQLQNHAQMLVYFSASSEFLSDVQITAANPASAQHWLQLI